MVAILFIGPGVSDGDLEIVLVAILPSDGGKFRALNDDLSVGGNCEFAQASANCFILIYVQACPLTVALV